MTKRIVVFGLGRIGGTIAQILSEHQNYEVTGGDSDPQTVARYASMFTTRLIKDNDFSSLLANQDAVLSALSFRDNPGVAQAALDNGCSYFDLTEDVRSTEVIKKIARHAVKGQVFVPQCGVAPGFINILGYSFRKYFDQLDTLKLRVGALPAFPCNQMMYNLTWSTQGLINEYANPCQAIKNYKHTLLEPLEGHELFSVSGMQFEAFNTSGGLANLCHSLDGHLREMTYKTIRYPGHCQLMRFLFRDLRLGEEGKQRKMLMEILENAVATTRQDLVLVSVVATGYVGHRLQQRSRTFLLHHSDSLSAIQIATASAAVTTLDLMMHDKKPKQGFVEQETLDAQSFLNNEFAKPYRDAELSSGTTI
ncbi:saccharopine dehydrogenase C-terminal domain-containing protein [Psychromonas sp.]|uniref:saccharopine dehydrogenase C-terminal domain-containing protein n=1 Tax=Psychromonas sp. TaxID=1884585 RepID=UPI003569F5A7